MKDNKNQSATVRVATNYSQQIQSESERQNTSSRFVPQAALPQLELGSEKLMRRYSFDDNGGGYMGL